MIRTRASKLLARVVMMMCTAIAVPISFAQGGGNVARIVVWQAKPGMDRDLEEGYKRHLEWHRNNGDLWSWYGWNIVSGERDGYFVDGTFFHTWKDLNSPVSPAADGADAAVNVSSYGDVRSAAICEAVPTLTDLRAQQLVSPLLTFVTSVCNRAERPIRVADRGEPSKHSGRLPETCLSPPGQRCK